MKTTPRDLRHLIENNKIENIYLFSGPEIGEKKEIITLITKKIFNNNEPVKYTFYCGEDFDPIQFMNSLKSGLLFSDNKIVILKNVEDIKTDTIKKIQNYIIPRAIDSNIFEQNIINKITKENEKKAVLQIYAKNENSYIIKKKLIDKEIKYLIKLFHTIGYVPYDKKTYLIMLNETKEKIPQKLTNLLMPQQNIIFWEMFESQKKDWLRNEFKKNDLYIEDNAISFILEMIENNKDQLLNETIKISSLFKESGIKENVIKREFIEEYLHHSKVETPFSLYSSMLEGNLDKSMEILNILFLTDEYSILNGIIWSHRRFIKALDLYENQKLQKMEIFSILRITAKKNKEDFEKGFSNYNYNHASLMFYYLSELDYYLKTLPNNLKLVKLQEFIISFIKGDIKKSFMQGPIEYLQT